MYIYIVLQWNVQVHWIWFLQNECIASILTETHLFSSSIRNSRGESSVSNLTQINKVSFLLTISSSKGTSCNAASTTFANLMECITLARLNLRNSLRACICNAVKSWRDLPLTTQSCSKIDTRLRIWQIRRVFVVWQFRFIISLFLFFFFIFIAQIRKTFREIIHDGAGRWIVFVLNYSISILNDSEGLFSKYFECTSMA